MVSIPESSRQLSYQSIHLPNWTRSINPLAGINWSELLKAYSVFIDNPSQGILHIIATARHSNWQKWVKARLARQAEHLENVDLTINIAELLQLPESTLGGAYARHITNQGFNPEAFATSEDTHWVDRRASLSHDVYHVIVDFDGTPVGEFGLAAFALVQYRDLLNVFVLSHVPYFMMGYPNLAAKVVKALFKGFLTGLKCKPIFAYPFEQNWQKPLVEVRQDLGIA